MKNLLAKNYGHGVDVIDHNDESQDKVAEVRNSCITVAQSAAVFAQAESCSVDTQRNTVLILDN